MRTIKEPDSVSVESTSKARNGLSPSPSVNGQGDSESVTLPAATVDQRVKVIKFSHVSKRFMLHHERPRSFQDMVVSVFGLRTLSKQGVALPRPSTEEFWALRDVNFSIYAGEAVGIIGENGSGKSTSLKLISRIMEPTSGSVSVRGKVSALLELGSGFHPELTGTENIFLHGSLLGIKQKDMAARYDNIVDFAEIREFIDTPLKHYSSGMTMRLGFAVAINVDPSILVTDEVLAVGDEGFQRKCLEHIAELRRRGVTIVFVSHALDAVRSLCQRAIWLDKGKVMADGPAPEVLDLYLAFENEKHDDRLVRDQEKSRANGRVQDGTTSSTNSVQALDTSSAVGNEASEPTEREPIKPFRPISIEGVKFLNSEGEEVSAFRTGEPFVIRIAYKADRKVEDPTFGLALYSDNGSHLNGPNTRFGGLKIPFVEGTGHVDYRIDVLPLLAGRYDVTVAVTGPDMTEVYDHQHRKYGFSVQPTPGLPERWGMLYIPATWQFEPDDAVPSEPTDEHFPIQPTQ